MPARPQLRALAERVGILPSYRPMAGAPSRLTRDATRELLLAAMGVDASSEAAARRELAALEQGDAGRLLAPVRVEVLGTRRAARLPVRWPAAAAARVGWSLELCEESGRCSTLEGRASLSGGRPPASLPLPQPAEPGYHRLRLVLDGGGACCEAEQRFIACAPRCYEVHEALGRGRRGKGLRTPRQPLRGAQRPQLGIRRSRGSRRTDAIVCVRRRCLRRRESAARDSEPGARDHALLAVEPALSQRSLPRRRGGARVARVSGGTGPRCGTRLRGAARCAARCRRDRPRRGTRCEAARAARLVRDLRRAARGGHERAEPGLRRVRRAGRHVPARLRHLGGPRRAFRRTAGGTCDGWRRWPPAYQRPDSSRLRRSAKPTPARSISTACQFEIERQLAAGARAAKRPRAPWDSCRIWRSDRRPTAADTWMFPRSLRRRAVGAPPDVFNADGQDWGLPPLDPHRCASTATTTGPAAARVLPPPGRCASTTRWA